MKVVAYRRKSTSGTDEHGAERQEGSFDRQSAAIMDYAKRKGIEIARWYEDEGISGKSTRKRAGFLRMVKDAQSPGRDFNIILFGEYDRFMRNVGEAWDYERLLKKAGVKLHFSNMKNDGNFAEEMYKDVVRRMAEEYSRELARKTIQGMFRKAKAASWLGGIPPYGYRRHHDPATGVCSLEVYKPEADVVRHIFRKAMEGWGHKRVAIWLNERGVPSSEAARKRNGQCNRNVDGRWSAGTVFAIIRNPVYKGLYRWNKRARVDCFDWKLEGQGTVQIGELRSDLDEFKREHGGGLYVDRSKPAEEWVVRDRAVPAIVEASEFDQLQARFQKRKHWMRGNNVKYFMSGSINCEACGNRLFGGRYNKILKSTGERAFYEYYRCNGDVTRGTHERSLRPMIRCEAIDSVVRRGIVLRAERYASLASVQTDFRGMVSEYFNERPSRLAQIEKDLARIERETERLAEAYAKFDRPVPEERIRELKAHHRALQSEQAQLEASGVERAMKDVDRAADAFFKTSCRAEEVLERGTSADRIALRRCFLKDASVSWAPKVHVRIRWFKGSVPNLNYLQTAPPPTFAPDDVKSGARIRPRRARPSARRGASFKWRRLPFRVGRVNGNRRHLPQNQ